MRPRISIRGSVRPSVGPSVGPLVMRFFLIVKMKDFFVYTMIFLKWTKLNRYCSACIHPKRLHNVSSKRPLKTVFDIVMAFGRQPQRGQCPMVPPHTMNTPFCLFLSLSVSSLPSLGPHLAPRLSQLTLNPF